MPVRPRGRPRGFDRDLALDRAVEAFWRRGYAGVSIADLTAAMGINSPSLYAAFGGKFQLFREAVERYAATVGAFALDALRDEDAARAAVARLLHGAADAYTARGRPRGCLVVNGATNCPAEDEPVARYLAGRRAAMERAIRARLDRAAAEGELPREADPSALAAYFAAVLDGIAVKARDGAPRATLHAVADAAMAAWPAEALAR